MCAGCGVSESGGDWRCGLEKRKRTTMRRSRRRKRSRRRSRRRSCVFVIMIGLMSVARRSSRGDGGGHLSPCIAAGDIGKHGGEGVVWLKVETREDVGEEEE
jgi:hypothetical protein